MLAMRNDHGEKEAPVSMEETDLQSADGFLPPFTALSGCEGPRILILITYSSPSVDRLNNNL